MIDAMREPLCQSCGNKDIVYKLTGREYHPKVVCVYDMANYPRMYACTKYLNKTDVEED